MDGERDADWRDKGEEGERTVILALGPVGGVAGDVEDDTFYGDEGGFGGVVAWCEVLDGGGR